MVEVPFAEFEKEFDAYMDRIEAGESFLIRQPDGKAVVAVPAGDYQDVIEQVGYDDVDDLIDMYSNHEEGS